MSATTLTPESTQSAEKKLSELIKKAADITGTLKESDLSQHIPYGNGFLPEELFLHLQKTAPQKLAELIKKNIIEKPKKIPSPIPTKTSKDIDLELEVVIEKAMKKINATKEYDLCPYISYQNSRLHHFTYEQLKKKNPNDVRRLIQENVLDKTPQKLPRKYRSRNSKDTHPTEDVINATENPPTSLEETIQSAMKRRTLNLKWESDICWYIPNEDGGPLFFSTFRSLKRKNPERLKELIQTHVVSPKQPKKISWKRSKILPPKDLSNPSPLSDKKELSQTDSILHHLETLVNEVRSLKQRSTEGSSALRSAENINKDPGTWSPFARRYLHTIQNQLIKKIRQKEIDYELWETFVDFVEEEKSTL